MFVFRKGFITVEKIKQILAENGLNDVVVNYNKVSQSGIQVSPGCLLTHYALKNINSVFLVRSKPEF